LDDDDNDDQKSENENESESEDEDEDEEELYTVTSFDDFDEAHEFAVSPDRIRRATTSPVAFKRQLSELVTKLYALLLKRAYADLTDTLHESVLGKSLASPRNLAGSPQRCVSCACAVVRVGVCVCVCGCAVVRVRVRSLMCACATMMVTGR
jgi:hypothetical protein